MPGSISLPQIVLELEEEDRKRYQALQAPKSMVVRFGYLRLIAELPYDGTEKPGCGSKLVIRTERGTEIGEMLTTTCSNSGCGKSVSRQQMLGYIEASGGRNFPFSTSGRILRVATPEDLLEQQKLDARKPEILRFAKEQVATAKLPMHLVDVEMLLGGERVLFHYTSEQWVDFRELVKVLAGELQTRIEMHQVNARDEARIVADFERCGQHCCCRQFLKVLKPVSMRMAKVQKATLDPAKISGRCGRLMCCLRYEDETYEALRKKLPHKQTRMMTQQGPGTVIDGQILTQLVLIKLDSNEVPQAFPLEEITPLPRDQDPQFNKPAGSNPAPGTPGNASGFTPGNKPTAGNAGQSNYPKPGNPQGNAGNAQSGTGNAQRGSYTQGKPSDARRDDSGKPTPPPTAPDASPAARSQPVNDQRDDIAQGDDTNTASINEDVSDSPSKGYRRQGPPTPGSPGSPGPASKSGQPPRTNQGASSSNDDLSDDGDDASDNDRDFDDASNQRDETTRRGDANDPSTSNAPAPGPGQPGDTGDGSRRKRRRRRRRRRGGGGDGGISPNNPGPS